MKTSQSIWIFLTALWSQFALGEADWVLRGGVISVSYTHLRAHETTLHLVCRLLLEKKKRL